MFESKGMPLGPDIQLGERHPDAPDAETLAQRMEKLRAQRETRN